jgi:hypothetical protein
LLQNVTNGRRFLGSLLPFGLFVCSKNVLNDHEDCTDYFWFDLESWIVLDLSLDWDREFKIEVGMGIRNRSQNGNLKLKLERKFAFKIRAGIRILLVSVIFNTIFKNQLKIQSNLHSHSCYNPKFKNSCSANESVHYFGIGVDFRILREK